jgi:hypothetical protein
MRAALIVLVLVALSGCESANSTTVSKDETSSSGLILSQYEGCNQEGELLVNYFQTGRPYNMDRDFGAERQAILAAPSREQRELAIRQHGDHYIEKCGQWCSDVYAAQALRDAEAHAARQAQGLEPTPDSITANPGMRMPHIHYSPAGGLGAGTAPSGDRAAACAHARLRGCHRCGPIHNQQLIGGPRDATS